MDLPIKFPDDADVIAEEAARFRALSPAERVRSIRGVVSAGALMMARSPKADFLRAEIDRQEEVGRQAVREFIARHA
jgi:hypothetical protein